MKLKPFVRDTAYFQVNRHSNKMLTGNSFDLQFTNLVNFLNKKIVNTAENLVARNIYGQLNSDGYLLRNIGDLTTKFDRLRSNDIPDNIITLDRFRPTAPNSILNFEIDDLTTMYSGLLASTAVLINIGGRCAFNGIEKRHLTQHLLKAEKVDFETLTINHLTPVLRSYQPAAIDTIMIADATLRNNKFIDGAFSSRCFAESLLNTRDTSDALVLYKQDVTGDPFDARPIKTNHFKDKTINFNTALRNSRVLTSVNIPLNAFTLLATGDIPVYTFFNNLRNRLGHQVQIGNSHIIPRSFVPQQQGGITKEKLSADILNALALVGVNI